METLNESLIISLDDHRKGIKTLIFMVLHATNHVFIMWMSATPYKKRIKLENSINTVKNSLKFLEYFKRKASDHVSASS